MTREEAQTRINGLKNKRREIPILDILEVLDLIKFETKEVK